MTGQRTITCRLRRSPHLEHSAGQQVKFGKDVLRRLLRRQLRRLKDRRLTARVALVELRDALQVRVDALQVLRYDVLLLLGREMRCVVAELVHACEKHAVDVQEQLDLVLRVAGLLRIHGGRRLAGVYDR